MLMNEKEKVDEHIKSLEETIGLLKNKAHIETWVVNEFLVNLNIKFDRNEIEKTEKEPSDIIFRNANFQIKAIYDEDRKMLQEYEDDLERARKSSNFAEALNFREYTPKDISIHEITNLIEVILGKYIFSPEQYQKIDMLFYFNRFFHKITGNPKYNFSNENLWKRWRSVSMVKNGGINFIFWAREDAPDFIKMNTGKIIFKQKVS